MIDSAAARDLFVEHGMQAWADRVVSQLEHVFDQRPHGDLARWQQALAQLPELSTDHLVLDRGLIEIGRRQDSQMADREALQSALQQLHPWRKGPYLLHGVFIDTEWRSDWKWERLAGHIQPLLGRKVLDVGCGNGYHCWRMAGEGAELVVGIDPTQLFLMQYLAVRHLISGHSTAPLQQVMFLPLGIEAVPENLHAFDTIFSMGVLYHRRSPIDHLMQLRDALRPDGELVLETLVVEGDEGQMLMPQRRYAKMRNVWFIPSVLLLSLWLKRCGFRHVRCIDVTVTSTEEQRSTPWMTFESLADFLHPADKTLTVEGLPAPRRAVMLATA